MLLLLEMSLLRLWSELLPVLRGCLRLLVCLRGLEDQRGQLGRWGRRGLEALESLESLEDLSVRWVLEDPQTPALQDRL